MTHKRQEKDRSGQSFQNNKSNQTGQMYFNNSNYSNFTNYSVKNSGVNMSNTGVLDNRGRVRDSGQYRDRSRGNKTFPNMRKRIVSGRELTTPLTRKRMYERAAEERIYIKVKTVAAPKKRFPVNILFCIVIVAFFLSWLIYSQTVLNELNVTANNVNDEITFETNRERILQNDLNVKNDINYIIDYAVNKLGMVNEDLLQKFYISGRLDDKVEVIEEKNNPIIDFPNIMSAIFSGHDE